MTIFGPDIVVDGKRPAWLRDDDILEWVKGDADYNYKTTAKELNWGPFYGAKEGASSVTAIRLLSSHWAYTAISKGFTPWDGGSEAPKDWDGGETLLRGGQTRTGVVFWDRSPHHEFHVIGYHPKPIAQPSPVDTVTVERMTEAEIYPRFLNHTALMVLRDLGILKETPTRAERIAKSTNLPLADVERVIAAMAEEG